MTELHQTSSDSTKSDFLEIDMKFIPGDLWQTPSGLLVRVSKTGTLFNLRTMQTIEAGPKVPEDWVLHVRDGCFY